MEFFTINRIVIRAPTELTVSSETLDKTERTMDGTMVVDIVGEKHNLEANWDYLSAEDMSTLAMAKKSDTFAEISFHDSLTGEPITLTMRMESLTYVPHYDWSRGKLMWKSVSASFKEK